MNNLDRLKMRALYANNDRQKERMIRDKKRALHRALLYSYQSGWIKKDADNAEWCRALINPNKLKFDYDEKIVSVDFKYGFKAGDSFEWPRDSGIHWLILKQELTELAYFRADIRRCQAIDVEDPDTGEKVRLWCAIRGPVETQINKIQKRGIVADVPNLSLDIYMVNNDLTRKLFDRYFRFKFGDRIWKVQAPDAISTPGILEIQAEEDYECHGNEMIIEPVDPNPDIDQNDLQINGNTFIKPLQSVTYYTNAVIDGYTWSITLPNENKEIEDVLTWSIDENNITIRWTAMISGQFVLHYGPIEKTIIVESLF